MITDTRLSVHEYRLPYSQDQLALRHLWQRDALDDCDLVLVDDLVVDDDPGVEEDLLLLLRRQLQKRMRPAQEATAEL